MHAKFIPTIMIHDISDDFSVIELNNLWIHVAYSYILSEKLVDIRIIERLCT